MGNHCKHGGLVHAFVPRAIALALALASAASGADAQSVRGTIGGDGSPLAGAVLQLVDSASVEAARALSRQDGSFVLRAVPAGRYRLVGRAIGFRPKSTALLDLRADTAVSIELVRLPVLLPNVTTLARNDCGQRADTSSATWELWDQATTALLSAAITQADREKEFRFVLSSRNYGLYPLKLRTLEFATTTLRGDKPWTSLPPDSLSIHGYVISSDSGLFYVAPDLDVLLSKSFGSTHCFRIHPAARSGDGLVGIDFAPAPVVRHADIKGTFWLDAASRELRSLEFTYANLTNAEADTLAGGRVTFVRLPTNEWIMPDWTIRAPLGLQLSSARIMPHTALETRDVVPELPKPTAVKIKRGTLLDVLPVDVIGKPAIWHRAASALVVHVTGKRLDGSDAPMAGAVVWLPESTRQGVTDSTGVVRFGDLVDGEYALDVSTSAYDWFFLEHERTTVTIAKDRPADVTVHAISNDEAMTRVCKRSSAADKLHRLGAVVGVVTRAGAPEADAAIVVEPAKADGDVPLIVVRATAMTAAAMRATTKPGKTSPRGGFVWCGLQRGVPLQLTVLTADSVQLTLVTHIPRDQPYTTVELAVPRDIPR